VHFLGLLSSEQLRGLYRHALAVLLPSAGYEVFPLVTLEAFQHRTAVIAHSLGGLTEILEQSNAGFLYHNAAELLSALDQMQSNPSLRREMGDRGYRAYQEKWTETVHLDSYFQILEETAVRKLGTVPWKQPARALRPLRPNEG